MKFDLKIKYPAAQLKEIMEGCSFTRATIKPGMVFLRGRKNNVKLQTISEVSYRKPQEVSDWGRCHSPGTSIFYATDSRGAIFKEVDVHEGDRVYVSYWQNNDVLLLNSIGRGERGYLQDTIPDKLHGLFMEPHSPASELDRYRLTSAITEVMMGKINLSCPLPNSPGTRSPDRFDGIMYPSIAVALKANNYAIRPEVVENFLRPLHVEEYQLVRHNGYGCYAEIIDSSESIDDGRINWCGRPAYEWEFNHPNRGNLRNIRESDKWVMRDREDNFVTEL